MERYFWRPTTRDIFRKRGINCARIGKRIFERFLENRTLIQTGDTYKEVVEAIEKLSKDSISLLPFRFRANKKDSDYGIKSLEDLLKIDSSLVIKKISDKNHPPSRLTKKFLETYCIRPSDLIEKSVSLANVENPKIGIYWVGSDNHARAFTWMRAIEGIEMKLLSQKKESFGSVLDKEPYGNKLRVKVISRNKGSENYTFDLFRLPIYKGCDTRQFSEWIEISHNSWDPDASYRGGGHRNRVFPVCVWSAPTIFSFYEAMSFVNNKKNSGSFRVNPFPIPTNKEMVDFINKLRFQTLIFEEKESLRLSPLNKTEMERIIGARTILRGYSNCWHHGRKQDLSYICHLENNIE